jgi:O-acetyl-ADP-ribose deacetylase (regulator of RNase III)
MNVIKGDLLSLAETDFDIIVHGANCFNTMGSGIAKQIKQRYPEAYYADCKTVAGDKSKLGTYTLANCGLLTVVNAYTQYNFNRPGENKDVFEYEAFQQILDQLVIEYPEHNFGFPMIGCGLAGGDPVRIIEMLKQFSQKIESTGGTVTLVEYK